MRCKLLLFAGFLFGATAVAGEHLIPERSVFANTFLLEYDTMVVSALEEAFTRDVRVRAIVAPSFEPEYAVGIKERENGYRVFCIRPDIQLWAYETLKMMKAGSIRNLGSIIGPPTDGASETRQEIEELEASLPANFRDVKIRSRDVEIASDLAHLLVGTWEAMLRQTRYDKAARFGFDGVSYHFSMRSDYQDLAGYVWSPLPSSTTGLLVKVVETIRRICDSDVSNIGDQLRAQADALRSRLQQWWWGCRARFGRRHLRGLYPRLPSAISRAVAASMSF